MALEAIAGDVVEDCAAEAPRLEFAAEIGDEEGLDAGHDLGPGVGLPFEAFLNPVELRLAHRIVDGLAPGDPQEEIHAWHLAATHLFAAERVGKARQPGLPLRPQQIEMGLAVRIMTLCDRKSAALDRHRAFRQKAAEKAEKAAEEDEDMGKTVNNVAQARHAARAAFLVTPETLSPEEWTRQVRPQQRRLLAGEPEPAGYPEARELLWRERCAYAVNQALARGESEGSLRAPYPTDEEVATRADADRRARQPAAETSASEPPALGAEPPETGGAPPAGPPKAERDP